jgi:hypothetical protein
MSVIQEVFYTRDCPKWVTIDVVPHTHTLVDASAKHE